MSQNLIAYSSSITFDSEVDGNDYCFRVVLYPDGRLPVPARSVWFAPRADGGSNQCVIGKAYIGRSALSDGGNPYDFAPGAALTQLTFDNGNDGKTITGGTWVRSDTVALQEQMIPGQVYIVSVYLSSGTSYAHYDATEMVDGDGDPRYATWQCASTGSSYVDATTWSSPTRLGGSTACRIYIFEALNENDPLELELELPGLEIGATATGGVDTLDSILPDLQVSASSLGMSLFPDDIFNLPFPDFEASILAASAHLEEKLPILSLVARTGAIADQYGKLPCLKSTGELFSGFAGSLNKTLAFPSLLTSFGWRIEDVPVPVPELEAEISFLLFGSLDVELTFPSLDAEGGREGMGALDVDIPPMEIAAHGGIPNTLNEPLFNLELAAHCGRAGVVDADLFSLELLATGGGETALVSELPLFTIWALGTHKTNALDTKLPTLAFAASVSAQNHLEETLPYLGISAYGSTATTGVDADLPAFAIEASAVLQTILSADLPVFSISAQGSTAANIVDTYLPAIEFSGIVGLQTSLESVLPTLAVFALGSTATTGVAASLPTFFVEASIVTQTLLDASLPVFDISAQASTAANILDSDLPTFEITATLGGETSLDVTLPFLTISALASTAANELSANLPVFVFDATIGTETTLDESIPVFHITASATHKQNTLDKRLSQFEISATGVTGQNTVDLNIFHLELLASITGAQATLDAYLPWIRADATMLIGWAATLDQILPLPSVTASTTLVPLMVLDAEIGPPFMNAESTASDDVVPDGGVIIDPSRWTTTVLRHSRW